VESAPGPGDVNAATNELWVCKEIANSGDVGEICEKFLGGQRGVEPRDRLGEQRGRCNLHFLTFVYRLELLTLCHGGFECWIGGSYLARELWLDEAVNLHEGKRPGTMILLPELLPVERSNYHVCPPHHASEFVLSYCQRLAQLGCVNNVVVFIT